MTDVLRVGEIFASLQGEGPAAGQSAGFLRLMGCNLSCTRPSSGPAGSGCDTAWTWDGSRRSGLLDAREILELLPFDVALYVLTGGEPLLQQRSPVFTALLPQLTTKAPVHVETNGTIAPCELFAKHIAVWVVSPKLDAMPMLRPHQNPALHPYWRGGSLGAHLKVVCRDGVDVDKAVAYADEVNWPRGRVWVMPEGDTKHVMDQRWPQIVRAAAEHRVNATPRLHILAGAR